jgi:hypothetical protein
MKPSVNTAILRTVLLASSAVAMTGRIAAAQEPAPAPAPAAPSTPETSPTPPPAAPPATQTSPAAPRAVTYIGAPAGYRRATTWDLNLDGAIGSTLGSAHALTGFGRVRAGVLAIRDANIFALGATYEYSNLQNATFGIQAEYISDNSGMWMQLGALLDTQPRPGAMLAVGYTLLGVEGQVRSYEPTGATFAVYAKLRIPIGFLVYELGQ